MVRFGKDTVLYVRRLKDAKTKKGAKPAHQIEHTLRMERATERKETKDGGIVTGGGITATLDLQAVVVDDEVNKDLYEGFMNGEVIEFWEVNLNKEGSAANKFPARYMQGRLTSWEDPAQVNGTVDLSTNAAIEGKPVDGEVTLTEEEQEELQYAFKDLAVEA